MNATTGTATTAKIKLLIVHDQERVRQDLRTALGLMQGLEVVGEAADGMEAVRQAEKLNPDVVLMDLNMPGMDGFEAALQRGDAYSYPDEETISDLAGEITISHPEMFCLPEVGPDEFEAAFDWFLS